MALYDSTTGHVGAFDAYHTHQVIIGNLQIPLFFRFTQNPNKLTFTMEKEYKQTKTIGGYVFEHWGKKPTIMRGTVLIKKEGSFAQLIGINTKETGLDLEDKSFNPELFTLQTLFDVDQRKIKGALNMAKGEYGLKNIIGKGVDSGVSWVKSKFSSEPSNPYERLVSNNVYQEPGQSTMEGYFNTFTDTIIYYKGCIYTGFFTKMTWEEDGKTPFTNECTFEFVVTGTTYDWIETMLTTTAAGRAISATWGAASSITTLGSLLKDIFKTTSNIF